MENAFQMQHSNHPIQIWIAVAIDFEKLTYIPKWFTHILYVLGLSLAQDYSKIETGSYQRENSKFWKL